MNIQIGDCLILGKINDHPAIAGIVRSIATIGSIKDNQLKDEDCVFLNDDSTPHYIREIKETIMFHIRKETLMSDLFDAVVS